METINNSNCLINRPGGFVITDRALNFCAFSDGAKILDLGCGTGATVNHIVKNFGFEAFGLDKNIENSVISDKLAKASAEDIPFASNSMDGIIMECSFSVVENQAKVLEECFRVLKADGSLIISDMFARGESAFLQGCLGRIETKENIINFIENNGFKIILFEDYSKSLQEMWGQMIFDKGAKAFYCELGVSPEIMKRIKCGYFLIVAVKK